MLRSRPNYREDNINNTNNITVIKNIDDEEPARGRRMTSSNITKKKKNSTTCESKERATKKGKKNY